MTTTVPRATGPEPGAARGVRRIWPVLGGAVVVVALVVMVVALSQGGAGRSGRVYEYTVPQGTTARIEAGEQLNVFPRDLEVRVGDRLVIHNDDTTVVEVGPYTVNRNATLEQTFTKPGTIVGICTIHPSGRVTITVTA
jgi:plastocyanin